MSFDLDNAGDDGGVMEEESEAVKVAAEMEAIKEAGTALVKKGEWEAALAQYGKAVDLAKSKAELVLGDFDAERRAERCVLACLSNMALCALKISDFAKAKALCAEALARHSKTRTADRSGRAKVLFRRGQAFLGLGEFRAAVDSMSEAIDVEEQVLGTTNREAALKSSADDKQRIATIQAMKRELQKARRAAREADKAAVKKGHKGFLNVKRLEDPKIDRRQAVDRILDSILEGLWGSHDDRKASFGAIVDRAMAKARTLREEAELDKDVESQGLGAFVEGFAAFVGAEMKVGNSKAEDMYEWSVRALAIYWKLRACGADLDPPLNLGLAVAHEATGHALMRHTMWADAKVHLLKYLELQSEAGEIPAYHNLPDSFLLQRGMSKMDETHRRAYRWKHRTHTRRSAFDAHAAIAAIGREEDERIESLKWARKCLEMAADKEERRTAHKNLQYLLGVSWDDGNRKPSVEEMAESQAHGKKAADLEREIDDEKAAKDKENKENTKPADVPEKDDHQLHHVGDLAAAENDDDHDVDEQEDENSAPEIEEVKDDDPIHGDVDSA